MTGMNCMNWINGMNGMYEKWWNMLKNDDNPCLCHSPSRTNCCCDVLHLSNVYISCSEYQSAGWISCSWKVKHVGWYFPCKLQQQKTDILDMTWVIQHLAPARKESLRHVFSRNNWATKNNPALLSMGNPGCLMWILIMVLWNNPHIYNWVVFHPWHLPNKAQPFWTFKLTAQVTVSSGKGFSSPTPTRKRFTLYASRGSFHVSHRPTYNNITTI